MLIVLLLTNYTINNLMLEPMLDDCRTLLWVQHVVDAAFFGEYASAELWAQEGEGGREGVAT